MELKGKKGTVGWLPLFSFAMAAVFLVAAWAGSGRIPAFRSTVYLLIFTGVFFIGRGLLGIRWFRRRGDDLVCRSLLGSRTFPAVACIVAYRSAGIGFGGRFLEIVCLRVHEKTGRPVPEDSFLAGWVSGFARAQRLARLLHRSTGIRMEGQLEHGPAVTRKSDAVRLIIIGLAVTAAALLTALLLKSGTFPPR